MDDRDADVGGAEPPAPARSKPPPTGRWWHRFVLAPTLLLVAVALGLLPFVVASLIDEFRGGQNVLYDLRDGQPISAREEVDPGGAEFLNVAAVDLDEAAGRYSGGLPGTGPRPLPAEADDLFALDEDVSQRRGIFALRHDHRPRGGKSPTARTLRYRYAAARPATRSMTTGCALVSTCRHRSRSRGWPPPERTRPAGSVLGTFQSQLSDWRWTLPVVVAATPSADASDTPNLVLDLEFTRPAYLPVLAGLLVLFVAMSSDLALLTQPIDGLMLGVGGLILAIWEFALCSGPSWLEAITAVDLALSGVIADTAHRRRGARCPPPAPPRWDPPAPLRQRR